MAHEAITINLTGQRIDEYAKVKAYLEDCEIEHAKSPQQVLSAAMQVFIAYVENGGVVTFDWDDARSRNSGRRRHG